MKKITEQEISEIKNKASKPVIYNGNFPINDISDREFETLCYLLFKERIRFDDIDLNGKFDNIDLMSGIGEKGYDATLYLKGKIHGLLQCKKYKNRITKNQFINEFLKFILYVVSNPDLMPDKNKFTYYFIASSGFANTTTIFLSNFNENLLSSDYLTPCSQIISKHASLKGICLDEKHAIIKDIIKHVKIEKVIPEDISQYLKEYTNIAKSFFKIFTATDNTLIDKVIVTYLEPILKKVNEKEFQVKDFQFRFKTYLSQVLNKYSSAQTLVFGNQQKKIEDYYYPLTLTCKNDSDSKTKINTQMYSDDFIPKYKKVLICDHGGMGKSTILKWLFRSVVIQNKGIPIFIELRSLSSKNTIIDEITTQLEPINKELEKYVTRNLIAQGGFVFFFDGYDEISKKNKTDVTRDLSNFITKTGNNLFVMSSRPESALKTFGDFQEFSIDRLTVSEAYELIKKIGNNNVKSHQLIEQLKNGKSKELAEFLESPLLTSLLYKKFEHRETIPLQKQEFYWEVFEALFQAHDIIKGDRFEREKESGLSLHDFHKILRGLAYFTALINQVEFSQVELERFVKKSNEFFPDIKLEVNKFLLDVICNVPIFQKEGLKYRWSHKTLQEYFASEFICRDTKENQGKILQRLFNDRNSTSYYGIMEMCYDVDFKSFRKHIIYPTCIAYRDYYYKNVCQYKSDDMFDSIVKISNQLFENRIAAFNPKEELIELLLKDIEHVKLLIEEHLHCQIQAFNIKLEMDNTINSNFIAAFVIIKKGFPLKQLLKNKKSNLLNESKIKHKSDYRLKVDYNTIINSVQFYFFPENLMEFVNIHKNDLVYISSIVSNEIYNISECEKLIKSVEFESEKEENINYFFQGLN